MALSGAQELCSKKKTVLTVPTAHYGQSSGFSNLLKISPVLKVTLSRQNDKTFCLSVENLTSAGYSKINRKCYQFNRRTLFLHSGSGTQHFSSSLLRA